MTATTTRGSYAIPVMAFVSILSISWLKTFEIFLQQSHQSSAVKRTAPPHLDFDKILFVDVRKSGGKQFKNNFHIVCGNECQAPDSILSEKITGYMHTRGSIPPNAIDTANAFLYNLRHPLDRLLAWYQMEYPNACIDSKTTRKACTTAREIKAYPNGTTALFFEKCFATQDALLQALAGTTSSECKILLQNVMNDKVTGPGFSQAPFQFDLQYYTSKTIDLHPKTSVLIVRSESIWKDLNNLESQLGGNASFHSLSNSEEYHAPSNDNVTSYGQPLCCEMMDEMNAYRRLLNLSVNLGEKGKEGTIRDAVKRCGFDSWAEMEKYCQNTSAPMTTEQLPFHNIMFVDIRKSKGSTMKDNFKVVCKLKPKECSRDAPESALSTNVKGYMHGKRRDAPSNEMIQAADAFLFDLRHPVDRLLALYHYQDPSYLHKDPISADNGDNYKALFAQTCFHSKNNGALNRDCTDIALNVIQNQTIGRAFKLLNYYTDLSIDTFPDKSVLVVRAESLWEDLDDLDLKLGGNGHFGGIDRSQKGLEPFQENVDTAEYGSLCCALQEDLFTYRRLLDMSENLDEASKNQTIADAVAHCGFESWEAMAQQCNEHLHALSSTLPYKKIVFTHVGKAGGQTLRVLFKAFCESDRTNIPKECNDAPSTMLSKRTSGYIHPKEVRPPGAVETADAFLFNLRHPVDRMLSWYHYESPKSCLNSPETRLACRAAKEVAKNPSGNTSLFFEKCFPTQDLLPIAFNQTDTSTLPQECVNLARKVMKGQVVGRGFKHISYNMKYYTNLTTERFPQKDVLVVRTSSLWDDLKDLDVQLGGNGSFGKMEGTRDSHGSEKYKKSNLTLSTAEYGLLCCALMDEMMIYRKLVERAVNLREEVKVATIASTISRCGFSSWDDMVHQCNR